MYDIVTVGAGPSGAYTSYLLAKEGFKVLLLDKGSTGNKLCTGIISEETFYTFGLDRGCIIRDINSIEIVAPSMEKFIYEHPFPFAHVVNRSAFDSSIVDIAKRAGATFLADSTVTSLEVSKDGVRVEYSNNGLHTVEAKALVFAAGPNRHLLRMIGLEPPNCVKGIQIEIDYAPETLVRVFLGNKIAPGSFAWVAPLGNGKARIGMIARNDIILYFKRFVGELGLKDNTFSMRTRPIPYGAAEKTYSNRVLVVGDAAGQVKTTTGGGIHYGLIGAGIAAQTFKEAFSHGNLDEEYLQVYEERWKKKLLPEIETGIKLRQLFAAFEDERINKFVNLARNDGIAFLIRSQAKFDWHKAFLFSLIKRLYIKDFPIKDVVKSFKRRVFAET